MKLLKFGLFTTVPVQKWSQKTIEGLNQKRFVLKSCQIKGKIEYFFADTIESFFFFAYESLLKRI